MAKRRGNHEGSINQRPNGRWQARISIDGERYCQSFKTKTECSKWLREIAQKKDQGFVSHSIKFTLAEYLDQWLEWKREEIKIKTWNQYRLVISRQIVPILGKRKLADLKPVDLQNLYSLKRKEGLSPRSVQMIHSILHSALQKATKLGLQFRNPASLVDRPRVPVKEMKVLSKSQSNRFLLAAKDHRLYALFRLAITCGLRLGELLGLQWKDLDWASSSFQVRRQLQRDPHGGMRLTQPKTPKSVRKVLMGKDTLGALMRHFQFQSQTFGIEPTYDDMIFTNKEGNVVRASGVQKAFKRLLVLASVPQIRFHDLRHTAASLLLGNGMPVIEVSRQLGHSRASTTIDIYGHLIPGLRSDAVEKVDQLMSQTAAKLPQNGDFDKSFHAEDIEKISKKPEFPSKIV